MTRLLHFPGVAGAEQFREIAGAALGDDVLDLLVHHVFVAREIVPIAENADRGREARPRLHVREEERVERTRMMRIVDDEVGFADAIAELHDFDVTIGFLADALVAVLAEDERFAVFEIDDVLTARIALGQIEPRAVVKDIAVLQNLDERGTFVGGCVFLGFFEVLLEHVDGTRHERGLGADRQ